jgi:branched-chain amino acid aminotransferase
LVGIPFHYETEELTQIAYQLLNKNNLSDSYIRPLVYCGPNMTLDRAEDVYLMMCAWEWDKYHGHNLLKLCVSSFQRPNPNSLKIEAKVTGHYVNSVLATSEAKVRGYDDAIMLDMNGFIAEAPGANFFMEKNGTLHTPAAGHILPGITRQTVLNICRELEIPVVERNIKAEELEGADSAFLCGTAAEIAGIESIDAKPFSKEWSDSLGSTVQEAYKCQVLEKSFSYVII